MFFNKLARSRVKVGATDIRVSTCQNEHKSQWEPGWHWPDPVQIYWHIFPWTKSIRRQLPRFGSQINH